MASDVPFQAAQTRHDDRRAAPRRTTRIDAILEHPGGLVHGIVVDISFGGAKFITQSTAPALAIGCEVVLATAAYPDTDSAELSWPGTIRRSEHSGDDGPERVAYAVAFDDSTAGSVPSLEELDSCE